MHSSRPQEQSSKSLEISFVDSIDDIGASAWNQLTGAENPFTRFEFLHALEKTGCTTAATGWKPQHVAVYAKENGTRSLQALMPMYEKTNSYGEYVFDWAWANAYQGHGLAYYPKYVSSVPFTPSAGKRVFVRDEVERYSTTEYIRNKVIEKAESLGISSWHILFPTEEENIHFTQLGISARVGSQFHWYNNDYRNFEGFLETLNSRKRKSIKKERRSVDEQGISFEITEGANITEEQWRIFTRFYESTYMMRGMQGYLNENFFHMLSSTMPEQLFINSAIKDGQTIAAALFFKSEQQLFGRYWGSAQDYQFLHFETCYYRGQDYCIEHGLKSFDSGAQGEHKIQRGFEPIITHSNHWISNPQFADAISNFLDEEEEHIKRYIEQAKTHLPYKQNQ